MRFVLIACAALVLSTLAPIHAAAITPEESKLQAEFNKAYRVPDKDLRKNALVMLDGAKHSSTWQLLAGVASSDPEADVRLAAFTVLAKEPARDGTHAHMLVSLYSALKPNELETRASYAQAMAPSQFKAEIVATLVDNLSRLRHPKIPQLMQTSNGQTNAMAIKTAEKSCKEFDDLLAGLNAVYKTEVLAATYESPLQIGKWYQATAAKIVAADKELLEKYKKEDAEAAKAAKAAK
ncbi:MAG: hypothetical protein WCT04_13605 [Planctomycetota bacterium]